MVLSAYLWHSEGVSPRNRRIILNAIARARAYGAPWILGADFQVPSELLMETVGEDLDRADAHVIATCATTHRPNRAAYSTID